MMEINIFLKLLHWVINQVENFCVIFDYFYFRDCWWSWFWWCVVKPPFRNTKRQRDNAGGLRAPLPKVGHLYHPSGISGAAFFVRHDRLPRARVQRNQRKRGAQKLHVCQIAPSRHDFPNREEAKLYFGANKIFGARLSWLSFPIRKTIFDIIPGS